MPQFLRTALRAVIRKAILGAPVPMKVLIGLVCILILAYSRYTTPQRESSRGDAPKRSQEQQVPQEQDRQLTSKRSASTQKLQGIPREPDVQSGRIIAISDGDTMRVQMTASGREERIRLLGIDTPESSENEKAELDAERLNMPLKKVTQQGKLASQYLKRLLNIGDTVAIAVDVVERDKFGRLLAYVWNQNNTLVNQEMLSAGFARTMFKSEPLRYRKEFEQAQLLASSQKKGLWSDEPCALR